MRAGRKGGGRLATVGMALSLFLLNFYICRELFGIEYLGHMGSIEGVFIALARFAMAHWSDLTWFPLWANGVPYQTAYPPLLPLLTALYASLRGVSPALAYHWVTALFYCLGPVALFALTLRLCGSRWAAWAAGLIYSSVSMSAWLVPAIARDLGGHFFPRRLQALVLYGEGPHVVSITLLATALLCLDLALERRRAPYAALAALALAAAALTNWLGAFAIILILVPYVLAHLGAGGWSGRELAWIALIGAAAYGLALPLMPPSTIAVLALNAKTTGGAYVQSLPAALAEAAGILLGLAAIKLAVRRRPRYLQFAILFVFLLALLTLADDWWGIAIVPMSARYHLEMEMALAILAALGGLVLLQNRPRWVTALALTLLAAALIPPVMQDRSYASEVLLRSIDIRQTIEWKKAEWINRHGNGGRVLIAGSTLFWWSVFSDIPELWGVDQGTTDSAIRDANWAIYNSDVTGPDHAATAVLWLKALGVQAVGVGGPGSQEAYQAFRNPKVFEGVLDPIWREGDDVIYRVGEGNASLARVVPRSALVLRPPANALDAEAIRPYVAALDEATMPRAGFRWTSMHSAEVAANLAPGQAISLQMAWAPGWHAAVNGRPAPVKRDAIGLMYIEAVMAGPCRAVLSYDGGPEMLVARGVSLLTALVLLVLTVRAVLRKAI